MSIRLRERDRLILRAVNDAQALQISHILTMFFGSKSPAYDRVKKLTDGGYLKRRYVTQVATAPAASPMVFTIDRLGAQVLVDSFDYDLSQINYATPQTTQWRTLQHLLRVNDVWAAVVRACSDTSDIDLLEWRSERVFRQQPDEVAMKKGSKTVNTPVYPDGYFAVATPRGNAHCFLEVDRGTESIRQFKQQMRIYQAYIESGGYQARFQTTSLRILVVTTGWRRVESLMNATTDIRQGDRYWFTTLDEITPEQILTGPIWRKLTDSDRHPFYVPPAG